MKKTLSWFFGVLAGFGIILVLLISSFEIVTYSSIRFYQHEYKKYDVASSLNMEMSDILDVTKQMMAYLRGNRADLVVQTVVGGEPREFFNAQEKSHMSDVRNLFLGGLLVRKISLGVAAVMILFVILLRRKKWCYVLAEAFQISTIIFTAFSVLLGIFITTDFNDVFIVFHKIFFTNNLWLFDPATSLMINMLPEGFFFDTVLAVGAIFLVFLVAVLVLSRLAGLYFKEDESVKIYKIDKI